MHARNWFPGRGGRSIICVKWEQPHARSSKNLRSLTKRVKYVNVASQGENIFAKYLGAHIQFFPSLRKYICGSDGTRLTQEDILRLLLVERSYTTVVVKALWGPHQVLHWRAHT